MSAGAKGGGDQPGPSWIWAAVGFVVLQVAVAAGADLFAPEVYDPEYAARLERICARRAQTARPRPLVLLGSSRTCQLCPNTCRHSRPPTLRHGSAVQLLTGRRRTGLLPPRVLSDSCAGRTVSPTGSSWNSCRR